MQSDVAEAVGMQTLPLSGVSNKVSSKAAASGEVPTWIATAVHCWKEYRLFSLYKRISCEIYAAL